MIRRILALTFLGLLLATQVFANLEPPVFQIAGTELTYDEMKSFTGRLHIFGINIFPRLKRVSRRSTPADPSREHCDIIAQNRAEALGLNTRDQAGQARNYNAIRVNEIYAGYPNNRSATPPQGSSGYYFTSYGNGKEHMGAYSRTSGSATYTRYMNRSFEGTERAATVSAGYTPRGVTSQRFVALPRRSSDELYYR